LVPQNFIPANQNMKTMKVRQLSPVPQYARAEDRDSWGRFRREMTILAELMAGGVTLRPHGTDRYWRLLVVVTDSRGRDVAVVMIREGLARLCRG